MMIMKKIVLSALLLVSSLLAEEKVMKSILDDVLLHNVHTASLHAKILFDDLQTKKELSVLKNDFKNLVVSWKKVETFYLAAEFNEDSIDTPRYIDVFHNLKENLSVQIQRVIDSKDNLDIEMYKHSFKTINALEYALYTDGFDDRRYELSKIIVRNIINRLDEINEVYVSDNKKFLSDFKWTNDVIINMLIDSSFKLRDWRVGDIAGYSRKSKGNADNKKAEYFISANSTTAIQSILDTHKQIMDSPTYDFGDMLIENGLKKEVQLIRNEINNSIENLKYLKNEDFENKEVKILYVSLDKLHRSYYSSLVNALEINTKILDADGD